MECPPTQGFLNRRCVTLGEALGDAGYHTGVSGKWHVAGGRRLRCWPNFAASTSRTAGPAATATTRPAVPQRRAGGHLRRPRLPPDGCHHEPCDEHDPRVQQGREAFFLYVAHAAPHFPLQAHEEDIARYRGTYSVRDGRSCDAPGTSGRSRRGSSTLDGTCRNRTGTPATGTGSRRRSGRTQGWPRTPGRFPTWDRGIGEILATLRELGIYERTLVLFMSDNGACSNELKVRNRGKVPTRTGRRMRSGNDPKVMPGPSDTWQSYGLSWANASNSPFRRFKKWVEEGESRARASSAGRTGSRPVRSTARRSCM